jgi:excisionase family DNA binding protein
MTAVQASGERLLTPAEVAALVFVDPKTVSRWASAGKIASTRTPGGHRRFRHSDVEALLPKGEVQDSDAGRTAVDQAVAGAVAIALEVQSAAAEAAVDTATSVAAAARTVAWAAAEARRTRAYAASEAAQLVATEAAGAAAVMRSRAKGRAGHPPETDELAAARVAQAVTDAAEHVAEMVTALDISMERETAAAAAALHDLTVATARHVAGRDRALIRRTSSLRGGPVVSAVKVPSTRSALSRRQRTARAE